MIKHLAWIACALPLTGCLDPSKPILAEALGAFDGPPPETANLQLKGVDLSDGQGFGLRPPEARSLFRANRGKPAHYLGVLEGAKVKGNTADVEVYPVRVGYAKRDCTLRDNHLIGSDCFITGGGKLVSVTCKVNDWNMFNQKTGGSLLQSLQVRKTNRKSRRAWPAIHLEGTLADLRKTEKAISVVSTNSLTPTLPPSLLNKWHSYDTFVLNDCAIRGIQLKVVG